MHANLHSIHPFWLISAGSPPARLTVTGGGTTIEMRASVRGNGGAGSHKQDMTQAKLDTDVRELASGGSALYLLD